MSFARPQPSSLFELQFPQSVGLYNTYDEAQRAVDYLSDEKFEVQNLAIVGTELKSVERVLGRRTWSTVVAQGVQSGLSTGLLVALVLLIFLPSTGSFFALFLVALGIGIVLGVGFAALGYALSRGRRDFTSVTPDRGHEVRGPVRAQGRRAGPRDAAPAARAPAPPPSSSRRRTPGRPGVWRVYNQRLRLKPAQSPIMISAIRPRTM